VQRRLCDACARRIERYQHSERARRAAGCCRFSPSCSRFAYEAFSTRSFPIAIAVTASRLARCNPLARRGSVDPLERTTRRRLRSNAVRTAAVLVLLTGGTVFAIAGRAASDPVRGGCTGSANGRTAARMTRAHPLLVDEHQTVRAKGQVPSAFAGNDPVSRTHVKIDIISDIVGVTTKDHMSQGSTWQSSRVRVDDYLKYGVGLYKYEIVNRGPGWTCTFVGYVKLGGDPLSKPVGQAGLGTAVVGLGGVLLAKRAKAKPTPSDPGFEAYDRSPPSATPLRRPGTQPVNLAPSPPVRTAKPLVPGGFCALALVLPLGAMPLFGMGGGSMATVWSRTVWKHGRPILGLVSGLLMGAGTSVLLWQYAVWTLNVPTAIGLPALTAVLGAVRGFLGTPYKLQVSVPAHA
jgi:putative component of membrane protein insertase Oxa1/YidC/SpoIIIJ protein YidD